MACINIDPSKFTTEPLSEEEVIDTSLESHRQRIRHLYRRIGFGASYDDINSIPPNTKFAELVDQLIAGAIATSLPTEFDWSARSTLNPVYVLPNTRLPGVMYNRMITNYWINECITESIKSKLLLFWHSHFAIKTDEYIESYAVLQYFKILFNNAFGDFKELVKKIGRTPMMLVFLSGFDSSGEPTGDYTNTLEPNENYARELLELFTMGVKDKNGVDNNYTTDDIAAIARAFTGWRVHRNGSLIGWDISEAELAEILDEDKFHFQYKQHDWGEKTFLGTTYDPLTEYWNTITPALPLPQDTSGNEHVKAIASPYDGTLDGKYVGAGTDEYNKVHDIIFEQKKEQIAYFICKKLYQFYVYADTENSNLDQVGLDSYISDLATTFIGNENESWNIEAVLMQIFKSQHFYDPGIMGTQIKSHIESAVSLFRSTALQPIDDNELGDYKYRLTLLTPDQAGTSEEVIDGVTNPNYNGVGAGIYYNNEGQINVMTGEGAPIEWVKVANQYFHDQQITWKIARNSASIGQALFMPPSVEGWPGHRTWINEYTLVKRQDLLLCLLTDISASAFEPRNFSALTREKFRQLAENLLVLKYGLTPVYEDDPVYGYGDEPKQSSQYENPDKLVRVLWEHFFSTEPEEKNVDGDMIGQVNDAIGVYLDGWNSETYGPSPNVQYSDGVAQRVANVIGYFVRQPEFQLT